MPRTVVLSITGRCNYRCRHCSVSAPDAAMGEMSLAQVQDVLRQIKECGLQNVTLIGGEPLVHPHFRGIVEYIQELGLKLQSIFTNGSLVTEELLDWLTARGLHPMFRTSYDGCGYHDKMRGVPGAEQRLYQTLDLLRRKGFNVMCDMSVCRENLPLLPQTVAKAVSYGVEVLTVYPPQECGNWAYVDSSEKLTLQDMYDYYCEFMPRFLAENQPISLNLYSLCYYDHHLGICQLMYNVREPGGDLHAARACRSFASELNISAAGYLAPCYVMMDSEYVKRHMPNVFERPLKELLQDSAYQRVTDLTVGDIVEKNEKCHTCSYQAECGGGCRGNALFNAGDITAIAPLYCEFFRSGSYTKFQKIVTKAMLSRLLRQHIREK